LDRTPYGTDNQFGNPFIDAASAFMPLSTPATLRHAEFLAVSLDVIRAAYTRMAAYFCTDIEIIGDMDDEAREDHKSFLINKFGLWDFCMSAGVCNLVYGSAYCSILPNIRRMLECPNCPTIHGIKDLFGVGTGVTFGNKKFSATCRACGYRGSMTHHDYVDRESVPTPHVWNPHDIIPFGFDGWHNKIRSFIWNIPSDVCQDVKSVDSFILSSAPVGVLEAATTTARYQFAEGQVHHWVDLPLSGIRSRGVGVPRSITSYRTMFQLQMMRRQNEVVINYHTTPFRVVSPAPAGTNQDVGDVVRNINGPEMANAFRNMLSEHRRDPGAWHFSMHPMQYQAFGADAKQLIPTDIMDYTTDQALNGIGMPVEIYKASLTTEQAPVGVRLFERFNSSFFHGLNSLLSYTSGRLNRLRRVTPCTAQLVPPRLADDLELRQILFNLAQSGQGSYDDFLRTIGKTYPEVMRKRFEEQKSTAKAQAEFERESQSLSVTSQVAAAAPAADQQAQQQQGGQGQPQQGQPQGGGAPPSGGDLAQQGLPAAPAIPPSGTSYDIVQLGEMAQAEAGYCLMLPQSDRVRRLGDIRKANQTYHQLVVQSIEEIRSRGESVGREQGVQAVLQGQA